MTDLKYKNYIFDFYGTLVDIETDEKDRWLWQQVLAIYASYGADYSPRSLSQKYLDLVAQEEQRLKKETAYEHVEIDLVPVFIRLLTEAEQTHATENKIDDLLTWGNFMASTFRVLSRKHLAAYENTLATLKVIKDKGGMCLSFLMLSVPSLKQKLKKRVVFSLWIRFTCRLIMA